VKEVALSRRDQWEVHFDWPQIVKALTRWQSNGKGRHGSGPGLKLAQLRARCLAGTYDLWVAPHPDFPARLGSVIVTTIVAIPKIRAARAEIKALQVELLACRDIGSWLKSAACTLSAFALANGCTHLILVGRAWRYEYERLFGLPIIWEEKQLAHYNHHQFQQRHHTEHPK
jgi:hypothetical protein